MVLFVAGAVFTLVTMTWPLLLIMRIGAIAALTPRADIAADVDAAAVVGVVRANAVTACDDALVVAATAALPVVAGAAPAALRDTA